LQRVKESLHEGKAFGGGCKWGKNRQSNGNDLESTRNHICNRQDGKIAGQTACPLAHRLALQLSSGHADREWQAFITCPARTRADNQWPATRLGAANASQATFACRPPLGPPFAGLQPHRGNFQ